MAQAVIMPKPGQTMEEAAIVKWHKKEGDAVKKGEVLFEIETDKAVLEAESFFDGTLLKVLVKEGVTVPVATVVAYIGAAGEAVPDTPPPAPAPVATAAPAATAPAPKAEPAPAAKPALAPVAAPAMPTPAPAAPAAPAAPGKLKISPRAKAFARAAAIEPSRIRGTGPEGRIVEKDVRAHMAANGYENLRVSPTAKRLAIEEGVDILTVRGTGLGGRIMVGDVQRSLAERPRPMSRMRQTIAKRLTQSFMSIPHFYVTVSVDMTNLLAYRKTLKDQNIDYSVTDFILEAVILSLVEFPVVNSITDGQTTRWNSRVDLGMAVGLEEGLVVPVIRGSEDLSMKELHAAVADLAAKARAGKLLPDEMSGSTFTVSNLGMANVESFNAIINPGESAILAVASTLPTVVAVNGQPVVRSIMKMTLSADHRIVDGMKGAQFINTIRAKLEDVELWKSLT
jgi:pyruvate dehydrogenase E2 component (dihydrolipoamide acetyltransferase)